MGEPTLKSILKSTLKKTSQLDLYFIDQLRGGLTSNETPSDSFNFETDFDI